MSEKAPITPQLLRWARTTANISLEKAAGSVPCSVDKLRSWEDGSEQPTISQAEKLAHYYRRPFAVLFLPQVPKDFQPLRDFRSKARGTFSTGLVFMIREIQEKQRWASVSLKEEGKIPLEFVGKYKEGASPEVVANDIRLTLDIDSKQYNRKDGLKYWIQKAEGAGIFVSLTSNYHSRLKLSSDEVKGFAIADKYAPFVFVNNEDYENPKLFTLVHELAHIWINKSGISTDTEPVSMRQSEGASGTDPVEAYCNQVTANVLLPKEELQKTWNFSHPSFQRVEEVARQFAVSNLTLLLRLFDLRFITDVQFQTWKDVALKQFRDFEEKIGLQEKRTTGGPNYYVLQLIRNGKAFSRLVLDFYKGGVISGLAASQLLHIKVNKFSAFEKQVYR